LRKSLPRRGTPMPKSLYTVTVDQLLTLEGMTQDLAFRMIDAVHERFGG